MSADSDTDIQPTDDAGVLKRAYRSVSPRYQSHPNAEMDSIGWAVFLGMLVLFVPLLPFLVIVWLLARGIDALAGLRGRE
ncbi:hypothetical protein C2R22_01540 [Salinigranum rubrum]|uniref:Uncharacterized protein n=1 Tax=Salinigranum rubrum TaxID=755307 RepID=A0A2I8VF20_9EURY|nr:hypothetical protein [Salinigranum rubrum]AUV80501.1 hypothetical protein C2R22_01540 [Salinigranum rubrum]